VAQCAVYEGQHGYVGWVGIGCKEVEQSGISGVSAVVDMLRCYWLWVCSGW